MDKQIKDKILANITEAAKAEGISMDLTRAARNLAIAPNMVLHPVYNGKAEDVKFQPIDATATRAKSGFYYIDTEEEVRLTAPQIARRGSGIKDLAGDSEFDRFCSFLDKVDAANKAGKKPSLKVVSQYSRPQADGSNSFTNVFSYSEA